MKKHSRTARSSKNAASPNARPAKKAISSSQPVIPWLVPPRTGKGSSISGEMTSLTPQVTTDNTHGRASAAASLTEGMLAFASSLGQDPVGLDDTIVEGAGVGYETAAEMQVDEIEDPDSDATEKKRTHIPFNRTPLRLFQVRYDWKVNYPPSDAPVEALREGLQALFDMIKNEDDQAIIYPWESTNTSNRRIKTSDDIPGTVGDLKDFFFKAIPRKTGGPAYVSVFLGHVKPFRSIHENIDYWLKDEKFGFYLKALQVERVLGIGWLLYSTSQMEIQTLKTAIENMTGVSTGIRWRMISTGKFGKVEKDQQVNALHIEIEAGDMASMERDAIAKMYSSTRTNGFPLGIRMRLVPEYFALLNTVAQVGSTRLRSRQAAFLQNVGVATTWEIANLDYKDQRIDKSLRDYLMDMPSSEFPHLQLFHSIDKQWRGLGYNIAFLPQVETEARTRISGLLPFLLHAVDNPEFHEPIKKFFSQGAIERAETAYWDAKRGCVVSEQDLAVEEMAEGTTDADYLFDLTEVESTAVEHSPEPRGRPTPQFFQDEDSVPTFAGVPDGTPGAPTKRSRSTGRKSRISSVTSVTSSASAITLDSRVSNMEASIEDMMVNQRSLMKTQTEVTRSIDELMNLLRGSSGNITQASPVGANSTDISMKPSAGGRNATGGAS
jgi:hypothetical protein